MPGVNQTSKMQNRYAMAQNAINNGLEQGTSQDIYAAQIQMVGRQQQQQSQQLIYHQHQRPSLQSQQPNITLQPQQQHAQQPAMGLMQPRSQPNQLQESQQHIMSQFQAQPNQLKKQLGMQQQFSMQQRVQTSGGMLLQQNNMDQKNVFIQAQKGLQEASSSSRFSHILIFVAPSYDLILFSSYFTPCSYSYLPLVALLFLCSLKYSLTTLLFM